jgi:hypothetical protein
VAFSTSAALDRALGTGHPRARIGLAALRSMLAEVGVEQLRIDPQLVTAPAGTSRIAS